MSRMGWWLIAALLLVACGGGGGDAGGIQAADGYALPDAAVDAPGPDLPTAPDVPPPDGLSCWPGTVNGCSLDETGLLICLDDGSGLRVEPCTTDEGEPGRCLAGACTRCLPGQRFCRSEDEVWQCDDTGMERVLYQDCNGPETGQVCTVGACVRLCELAEKWSSYIGCDYWAVDLDNAYIEHEGSDAMGGPYAIVISNPHASFPAAITITRYDEASGEVQDVPGEPFSPDIGESDPARPFPSEPIAAGDLRVYYLPRRDVNGTSQGPLAYHVRASIPITACQFNPLENIGVKSNDGSLLLPANVLGRYYLVMSREQTYDYLRSFLTVIAVTPGETEVSVDVTAPTLAGVVPHLEPGDTVTRTLRQYDVLNIETDAAAADLTGSVVYADKPVAVYGGGECVNVPNTEHCGADGSCEWAPTVACERHEDCFEYITGFCDHVESQLWPVEAWGKEYLCAKSFDRALEKDAWRVLASEDGTRVETLPPQAELPILNRGEWAEFLSDEHFLLVADKPVMVGQFLSGQDAPTPGKVSEEGDANIGDPAFIVIAPSEQFRDDYVFLAPPKYELDYVSIVAPLDTAVRFDGAPVAHEAWQPLGDTDWRVARFRIEDGTHHVDADDPVGVYVYGYDHHVSYGYPAGLDLRAINQDPIPR